MRKKFFINWFIFICTLAVNLRILFLGGSKKVSPPFEGGVAGTIDYMIYTKIISRPGWLIYLA
ncbi:MAG TPA: hypothetical protein DF818_03940 [Bacteroidales bacterium]|nr:hypothetical protein [Bacteroidales bacterium]